MQTWLQKIIEDFSGIEETEFGADEVGDDFPEWVRNIFLWLLQASFPKVKMPSIDGLEPRSVGGLVAYKFLYAQVAGVWAAHPNPLLREVYGEAGKASVKFMEATKRALAAAVDAPLNEGAEFFNGFGHVFKRRKPQAPTQRQMALARTQAVYIYLALDWKNVPTGITSSELFIWLDKRLPPEIMGSDPDWIRGICTRIGFPLARVGPPKKSRRR